MDPGESERAAGSWESQPGAGPGLATSSGSPGSLSAPHSVELSRVEPRRVLAFGIVASLVLAVVSVASHVLARAIGTDSFATFDVGDDVSIGAWFEALLMTLSAVACFAAGRLDRLSGRSTARSWFLLAAVMLFVSVDEAASIHERTGGIIRDRIETSGYLYYVWVIPFIAFALAVAVISLRLLRTLPRRVSRGMVLGGAGFVLSAAGLEVLAAPEAERAGNDTVTYIALTTVEELGEMVSVTVFLAAVLTYLVGSRLTLPVGRSIER